jgi:hypothetical protein
MALAPNFLWCTSGCGSGQIHSGGTVQPIVTCLHCSHRSCFHHGVQWHQNLTCDEYDQLRADPENFRSQIEMDNDEWEAKRRAQEDADRAMAQGLQAQDATQARERQERELRERDAAKKALAMERVIMARRKKEDEKSAATVNKTTKPCPGCGWHIEKNQGW